VLGEAEHASAKQVRKQALALAESLARQSPSETLEACRDSVRAALRDEEADNRLHAIHLASQPGFNMLEPVVGLLSDPHPEVRRAALLAVGPVPEVLATDDLLHWLHDPDANVRRVCEGALRGRGLHDQQIKLGRLMSAADAQTRLQVLGCLSQTAGLEPAVWLRRLSHDPAPAVRAAAVRAALEFPQVDLADRLEQIVQNDPSPTVRQLAHYYLSCRPNTP
jgi:HEAT repeat protein